MKVACGGLENYSISVEIDTEDLVKCSKFLVSLDGAEGRQSKPYHMSKVSNFINIDNEKFNVSAEGITLVGHSRTMEWLLLSHMQK